MPRKRTAPINPDFAPPNGDLPRIMLTDRQLPDVYDDAVAALLAANTGDDGNPQLFSRDSGGCYLRRIQESDRLEITELSLDALIHCMGKAAHWEKQSGRTIKSVFPDRMVAGVVRSRLREIGLPYLAGVTPVPLVLKTGELLSAPGYHAQSGYYYAPPAGFTLPEIPEKPTDRETQAAGAKLLEPFEEFPFAADADRAAILALMLTILARPLIEGPTPLLMVEAPTAGTGKGKLVDTAAEIVLGAKPATMAKPSTEDEMEKRLLAELSKGPRLIYFDNVHGTVRSQSLEMALTSELYKGRELGRSNTPEYPNRAAWVLTGNNASIQGDLPRRIYTCRIDARVERPEERSFKRSLPTWAREHRAELVAAALTLIRAWVAAGRPEPAESVPIMGSFESWRHVVGGVLRVAGVAGFLANRDAVRDLVVEDGWPDVVRAWHGALGSEWISARELADAITCGKLGRGLGLEAVAIEPGGNASRAVGEALKARRDAWISGFRIERTEKADRNGVHRWRVLASASTPLVTLPTEDRAPLFVVSGYDPGM